MFVFVLGLIVIVSVIMWMRRNRPYSVSEVEGTETETVVEEVVPTVAPEPFAVETVGLPTEQIDLSYVGDQEGAFGGLARRGTEGDLFTHVVVADLQAIDMATSYYEGWLVKPGVVDYFSTGAMFAREDGKWGLVYETRISSGRPDLFDFTKVVVTREDRDDNPAPSAAHVLEGQF